MLRNGWSWTLPTARHLLDGGGGGPRPECNDQGPHTARHRVTPRTATWLRSAHRPAARDVRVVLAAGFPSAEARTRPPPPASPASTPTARSPSAPAAASDLQQPGARAHRVLAAGDLSGKTTTAPPSVELAAFLDADPYFGRPRRRGGGGPSPLAYTTAASARRGRVRGTRRATPVRLAPSRVA